MTEKNIVEDYANLLRVFGEVRYRAMFGEYGVYINEKFQAIVGDNRLFLKIKGLPEETIEALFGNQNQPYEGAKNYAEVSMEKIENPEWVEQVKAVLAF